MILVDYFLYFGFPNILKPLRRRDQGVGPVTMIVKGTSGRGRTVQPGILGVGRIKSFIDGGIPAPEPLMMKSGKELQPFVANGAAHLAHDVATRAHARRVPLIHL